MADYVNNVNFMNALIEYKEKLKTNPNAKIPEYIGKCILDISNRFASRPNFYGYSFKDEMVSDGIENCIQYLTNYDPQKSSNPFAYFTQICYYAFIRRIQREKKQSYIKHQLVKDMPLDSFEVQDHDDSDIAQTFLSYIQSNNQFDSSSFEKTMEKKPKKHVPTPIEKLMTDE